MKEVTLLKVADSNQQELYSDWLVKVDKINKTLQWREEHWLVENLDPASKEKYEKRISIMFPDCKWLKPHSKNGVTVWAKTKKEARELLAMFI